MVNSPVSGYEFSQYITIEYNVFSICFDHIVIFLSAIKCNLVPTSLRDKNAKWHCRLSYISLYPKFFAKYASVTARLDANSCTNSSIDATLGRSRTIAIAPRSPFTAGRSPVGFSSCMAKITIYIERSSGIGRPETKFATKTPIRARNTVLLTMYLQRLCW